MGKKERTWSVVLDFGEQRTINKIFVDPISKRVKIYDDDLEIVPANARTSLSYERAKSPKVLLEQQSNITAVQTGDLDLFSNHDLFYAIDTNTRPIGGESVSVASIILGRPALSDALGVLDFAPIECWEFRNAVVAPERLAWTRLVQSVLRNRDLPSGSATSPG